MPELRKPRALRPGDGIALVAPASPFAREDLDRGVAEIAALGFRAVYDASIFARTSYVAGPAEQRAAALLRAWTDPDVAAIIAMRGGYGSVQLLPHLRAADFAGDPKAFVAYSDNTSLLSWLTLTCGVVTFHGPMVEGRLARGAEGYDRDSFLRVLCEPAPAGAVDAPGMTTIRAGRATGPLLGGTLTQLLASLGTPYAFDPPDGYVLFVDEVGERPYRLDRMLTQLQLAGLIDRASAVVFNELPGCDEPAGAPAARQVVERMVGGFQGPVLFGLPSGHTRGATVTLPFGVRVRVETAPAPAVIIEEAAVV